MTEENMHSDLSADIMHHMNILAALIKRKSKALRNLINISCKDLIGALKDLDDRLLMEFENHDDNLSEGIEKIRDFMSQALSATREIVSSYHESKEHLIFETSPPPTPECELLFSELQKCFDDIEESNLCITEDEAEKIDEMILILEEWRDKAEKLKNIKGADCEYNVTRIRFEEDARYMKVLLMKLCKSGWNDED